jgi:riboflavin biosynthesis pyrimidine reductase
VRRLHPDPGPTTIERQLEGYEPRNEERRDGRPFVAMNFATTADGRATISGVSGPIGSDADTAMLVGLRTRFDAVLIGAGTMRAERYGSLPAGQLLAIVTGNLDLPWDAPLFAEGGGPSLVFTTSDDEPPPVANPPELVRHSGSVDMEAALRHLREEHGVRALLSEGGPRLHAEMQAAGLVDELFLTIAPKLAGGAAPRILEGELPGVEPLELAWLLEEDGELFARYRRV